MTSQAVGYVNNISKRFGKTLALDDVSFDILKGKVTILLGHNGSGKSTLLHLLSSLETADQGEISIFEGQNKAHPENFKRKIGMVFDHNAHFDKLTGYENAWFFARSYGMNKKKVKDRLEYLFDWINLSDKKDDPVSNYSYGMKRKLALLESVIHEPELLFMDEPSMGLDYSSRLEFYKLISDLTGQDVTVVIATNDIYEAALLADQVILLKSGKIMVKGTPESLLAELQKHSKVEIVLSSPVPLDIFDDIEGIEQIQVHEKSNEFIINILLKPNRDSAITEIVRQLIDNKGVINKAANGNTPFRRCVFEIFIKENCLCCPMDS